MPRRNSARSKRLSRKEVRDLDTKITFLEGIVKRDGDYVEALQVSEFEQRLKALEEKGNADAAF